MNNRNQTIAAKPIDAAMGLHIRERRRALGMSQSTLAETIGLTFQQIQKYERGFNRVSFSRLVEIAHALDCRVVDLIADLDEADSASSQFRTQTTHLGVDGAAEMVAGYAAMPRPLQKVVLKLLVEIAKLSKAGEFETGGNVWS